MTTRMNDLPAALRDLTAASLNVMDARWDPARSLLRHLPDGSPPTAAPQPEDPVRHDVRGTSWYALGLLLRGDTGDRERAVDALRAVLDQQYDEPGAPYHGTFRRFPEEPHPGSSESGRPVRWRGYDPNWRQFIGTTLAIILEEYSAELPGDLIARIDAAIRLAVVGEIEEDRLSPRYTNIALMRAPLDIWAGTRYGRGDWFALGQKWIEEIHTLFSAHQAFEEYNSPTYYGPDLFALGFWRRYTPSDRARAYGSEMETALWRDIARYYHAGLRNMCGPYSRAYGMDMRCYVAILGHAIWGAAGRQYAPHPDPAGPMAHANDIFYPPCLALVGVCVPEDVLPTLREFPGPHLVEQRVISSPEVTATAWLEDACMLGGMHTSGLRAAGGQFHPVTIHWRAPDSDVGWIRMVAGDAVDARASRRQLSIACCGEAAFEVYAAGEDRGSLSAVRWDLPGLSVDLDVDSSRFSTTSNGQTLRAAYSGLRRAILYVTPA